jgi:hypothetical protein
MKNVEVHLEPRKDVNRTKSPTDMLMTTACYDAYRSLTLPQRAFIRVKQLFRPRDSFIDQV